VLVALAASGAWWMGMVPSPGPVAGPAAPSLPAPPAAPVAATPVVAAPAEPAAAARSDSPPARAASPGAEPRRADSTYERCMGLTMIEPRRALAEATAWSDAGGGDAARHCTATALIQLGEEERAAALLEELGRTALAPADARAALFAQAGQLWLAAGRPDRAHAAATSGLAARPDDPDLLTDRAIAAASQERFAEAIEDLSRAMDLRPRQAETLVLRASAWRQSGQRALAADDLARALALDPSNPEALLERGLLRRDGQDLAGARADWEATIGLAPRSAAASLARDHLARLEDGEGAPAGR
jgi:tetratricopeptide (TPR) repeat protein